MYRPKSKLYPEIKDVKHVGEKEFRDGRNNRNWVLIVEHSRVEDQCRLGPYCDFCRS